MSITIDITVDDLTFHYTLMDAFAANDAWWDFASEFVTSLGGLLSLIGSKNDDDAAEGLESAFGELVGKMTGKRMAHWFDRMCPGSRLTVDIEGQPQRLTEANKRVVFDDFTQINELFIRVLMAEFAGPLARRLTRSGLADKIKASLSGLSQTAPAASL